MPCLALPHALGSPSVFASTSRLSARTCTAGAFDSVECQAGTKSNRERHSSGSAARLILGRESFPFFSCQVYEVKSQITLACQDAPPKNTEQESMTAQVEEFVPSKEDTTEKEFICDCPLQNYDLISCLGRLE